MLFGAKYARKEYLLGKPDKVWVPLALRADISMADQSKLAEQIGAKLRTDEMLRQVVIDVGLQEKFNQPSQDAAVKDLDRRLFVEAGSADTPAGTVPSINVGVRGTGHEHDILGEASMRIIKDVWRILGIDPDTGKPLDFADAPPLDPY
jgi:hypothetical protein